MKKVWRIYKLINGRKMYAGPNTDVEQEDTFVGYFKALTFDSKTEFKHLQGRFGLMFFRE